MEILNDAQQKPIDLVQENSPAQAQTYKQKQQAEPSLLFVDALNYSREFWRLAKGARWPSPQDALRQVKRFVDAASQSGWTLEVFIDDRYQSSEALNTWFSRREKEVKNRTRMVPQGVNRLLGDMFAHVGVPVHCSHDADNDDTIVAHAFARSAAVLSADRDMYRYTGIAPPLRVFESFRFGQRGSLQLFERPESDRCAKSSARAVIVPPPGTNSSMHSMWGADKDAKISYYRGSPSPLTRDLGNIHLAVRQLRQAVYHRLGVKGTVHEVMPFWSEERVKWTDDHVAPYPELSHLLDGVEPVQVVAHLFPDLESPPAGLRPELVHNHAWAVRAIVYELLVIASGGHPSLLDLMNSDPFFSLPAVQSRPSNSNSDWGRDRGYNARGRGMQRNGGAGVQTNARGRGGAPAQSGRDQRPQREGWKGEGGRRSESARPEESGRGGGGRRAERAAGPEAGPKKRLFGRKSKEKK
jgi:hypothetical protein